MSDNLCSENPVHTVDEIVHYVLTMKPHEALDVWERPNKARPLCCTCIYTRIQRADGSVLELTDANRIAAIYIRVSTERQRTGHTDDGGIGLDSQIKLALLVALKICEQSKSAFRIYTDAGFSGTYPPDDPQLIQEMRETRANMFEQIFRETVIDQCAGDVQADMERYLKMRLEQIRGQSQTNDELKSESNRIERIEEKQLFPTSPDRSFEAVESALKRRFQHHNNYQKFRPALHFLLEDLPNVRAICVYDVDRLSRDAFLSEVLSRRFMEARLEVFSPAGQAGYMTGQSWEDSILRSVVMGGAANFINKNLRQIMRSHYTALSRGMWPYTLPFYLARDKRKRIVYDPYFLPVIVEVLRGWMDMEDFVGSRRLAARVNAMRDMDGKPYLPPKSEMGIWNEATLRYNWTAPFAYGCVAVWGREWTMVAGDHPRELRDWHNPILSPEDGEPVAPLALISRKQWEATIRARIKKNPSKHGRLPKQTNTQALTGLLKCRCGATMYFHARNVERKEGGQRHDHWACHSTPDAKRMIQERNGLIWHFGINNGPIQAFISDLFREAPHLLHRENDAEDELDEKRKAIIAIRQKTRDEFKEKARETALSVFGEENPAFEQLYNAIKAGFEAQDENYQQIQRRLDQIDVQMRRKEARKRRGTEEEEKSFDSLPKERQNEIMQSYIKEVVVQSPHGQTDLRDESLVFRLHGGGEIEIPLLSTMQKNGCPRVEMRLFKDWLASLKAV